MDEQLLYQVALSLLPGIGGVQGRKLLRACGNAEAVFREKKDALMKVTGVGASLVESVKNSDAIKKAEKELEFMTHYRIRALFCSSPDYPQRLKHCEDSPLMLFFKGSIELNPPRTIAVVGTRKPTDYGRRVCADLVRELATWEVVIVSGLAYGIDTMAHQSALQADLDTIGVLGHGLDQIYPFSNRGLAERMIDQGGLLTEFPSGIRLNKDLFPRRNRVIAGLSDATVVVESAEKGGALITADIANSYNRDVFAMPGRIDDPKSKGCNELIRSNRAALARSAADISYLMGWDQDLCKGKVVPSLFPELSPDEAMVMDFLKSRKDAEIDMIYLETGLSPGKAAAILLKLEFMGLVKCLPGKVFRHIS